MITEAILNILKGAVQFLLGILPNVPPMPSVITDGLDYFSGVIAGVVGIVSYLESPAILGFAFTAILVILNFDNIYKLVHWVIHKIRG